MANSNKPSIEQFRNTNLDSVRVLKVIEIKSIFGDGDPGDDYSPIRQITEYFDFKGNLLARIDKARVHAPVEDSRFL